MIFLNEILVVMGKDIKMHIWRENNEICDLRPQVQTSVMFGRSVTYYGKGTLVSIDANIN